jgi:ribosomal protein S27AE
VATHDKVIYNGMMDKKTKVNRKTYEMDPKVIEKGICPQCGGELFASQAMMVEGVLYTRWECKGCTFTARLKKVGKDESKH